MKSHLVRRCNESGTKDCTVCITSPFPRDRSSFEAFRNLKIDSHIGIPLPHLMSSTKTGNTEVGNFVEVFNLVCVCNKLRLEVPFTHLKGNTTHPMSGSQPNLPLDRYLLPVTETQMISLLFFNGTTPVRRLGLKC